MDLESLNPDSVEEIFARHGAASITFTDAGNDPVLEPAPGDAPLWADTRICGLFSADADIAALRDDLRRTFALGRLPWNDVEELADRAWEREWLRDFAPMRFGTKLWICPGDTAADDEDAVVVRLDPGLAFGTGTHATTALCLDWLDSMDLDGLSVLDYGCGSGVLAIAALKLGAASATGTDIDPQAITASRASALANDVGERFKATIDARDITGRFDVVVANILAGPLVELAESIVGFLDNGCPLALSGILSEQVDEVLAAYSPWIRFDEPELRDHGGQNWALLTGRRIEN